MALTGLTLDSTIRNNRLAVIKDALDSKSAAGKILFYSQPLPQMTGEVISSQILLATCALNQPSGSIANQRLVFDTISDELATPHSGTIAFGRLVDGDGNFVGDGTAGLANSAAVFKFNSLDVVQGGMVRILSGAFNEANA